MTDALRVGLDVSAVPDAPVGAGQYSLELARALSRRGDVDLVAYARRSDALRWLSLGVSCVAPLAPDRRVARLVFGELVLGRRLGAAPGGAPAVFHGPHYTLPLVLSPPGVVTVHDMTLVEHPEWHERSKARYFPAAMRRAARHAACVICPSRHTADAFSRRYAPSASVHIVPHGVDHERFDPVVRRDDAEVLARHGLVRAGGDALRYVLHVGTLEPRKDVVSLVTAFDELADADDDLHLVLAGRDGWGLETLESALARARARDRVRRLGYVADHDVPALLRGAAAVAYPSFEEGFGLPALEALACGAPLVTTERTAMAEIAGDAALLVPAGFPGLLGDALAETLAGGVEVERRRREGLERSAAYTWEASADGHLLAYREAVGR